MILPLIAADAVDLGDARCVSELGTDHPVLKRAQVFGCIGLAVRFARVRPGLQRIHEDFAEAGGDRSHFRHDALGKLVARGLEPLVDELAREIDAGAIGEHCRYLAEAIARHRAGILQPRQAGDGGLDWEGDALFGLKRREAGGLAVDLYLDIGDVGRCVDRETLERPDADCTEQRDDA